MKPAMTRAAGYVRVSTDEQVKHGWNLDEDRERIRELAAEHRWSLDDAHIFDDGGLQGDDCERPELRRLLDSLDDFDVLILRDLDRYARHLPTYLDLRERVRQTGVQVWEFTNPRGPVGFDLADNLRAVVSENEKKMIGVRVKLARDARRRAGLVPGGPAPLGYEWVDKRLVVVPERAKVVERVFRDYTNGASQRSLAAALNAEGVPTSKGGRWSQSHVSVMLAQVLYNGRMRAEDGSVIDAKHEAIIDDALWQKAQAIRSGALKRKPGRHADGGHFLTRGVLRCGVCGGSMLARKARHGERERYTCTNRYEGRGCTMRSFRREAIDVPFFEALTDRHLDAEKALRRYEARAASALARAREALAEKDAEVGRTERALATTERDYDGGDITGKQYSARHARLTDELEAGRNARQRAQERVEKLEQSGPIGDAEHAILSLMAAMKRAAAETAEGAPDLRALRNTIAMLFDSIHVVRAGETPYAFGDSRDGRDATLGDGATCSMDDAPVVADGQERYELLLVLRSSAMDDDLEPIRAELPVPDPLLVEQTSPHS